MPEDDAVVCPEKSAFIGIAFGRFREGLGGSREDRGSQGVTLGQTTLLKLDRCARVYRPGRRAAVRRGLRLGRRERRRHCRLLDPSGRPVLNDGVRLRALSARSAKRAPSYRVTEQELPRPAIRGDAFAMQHQLVHDRDLVFRR